MCIILRLFAAALLLLAGPARAEGKPPPRLAVIIVVDQMRADYLTGYSGEFSGGFKRLLSRAAVFTDARHDHVPTHTATGHAALATGRYPKDHGIIANDWWDREAGGQVNAVGDPEFGRSPRRLSAPALGDLLKEASPGSKTAAVAGQDRSAIPMGGKKADAVLWFDEEEGRFVTSRYYGKEPDWLARFNRSLGIKKEAAAAFASSPALDAATLALARRLLEELELGADATPDLLSVTLSATDVIGHAEGTHGARVKESLLSIDKELGEFMDFLDARHKDGSCLLVLTSDHGALPPPEGERGKALGAKRLSRKDFDREVELSFLREFGPPPAGDAWMLAFRKPHVYLNTAQAERLGLAPEEFRAKAARLLNLRPEVERAYTMEEMAAASESRGPFLERYRRSWRPEAGDLMILLKSGVLLTDKEKGTGHGLPYDYDSRVPLVFWGAGVVPGVYGGEVLSVDVAPAMAQVLGVPLAPAEGRALLQGLPRP